MPVLTFLIAVVLLAAAITGVVFGLIAPTERRRRRGLLVGSVVVGVLAITSIVLMLPSLADHVHVKVILITPGSTP